MANTNRIVVVALLIGLLTATPRAAQQANTLRTNPLRTNELTRLADLIATGVVTATRITGHATFTTPSGLINPSTLLSATLTIDRVLKGPAVGPAIQVSYFQVDPPLGTTQPFGLPFQGQYRVFFLAHDSNGYTPVSPVQTSLPAARVSGSTASGDLDRVCEAVSAVFRDPTARIDTKTDAIMALLTADSPAANAGLRVALRDESVYVRYDAAAALLRLNDPAGLDTAEEGLSNPASVPRNDLRMLRSAIGDLELESAIPLLTRLMASQQVETRRAAAEGLANIGSPAALGPLAQGLLDPDADVAYWSVSGLHNASGQGRGPGRRVFDVHRDELVAQWQAWARARGLIK